METPLKATLIIEGPLPRITRLAAELAEKGSVELTFSEAAPEAAVPASWTPSEFHVFWTSLSSKSRTVLAKIAERPAGYPVDQLVRDLEADLGGSGHVISGALSSVGHRQKQFKGKERVYVRDFSRGVFTMSDAISELIRKEESK